MGKVLRTLCAAATVAVVVPIGGAYAAEKMVSFANNWYAEGRLLVPMKRGFDADVTSNVAAANGSVETDFHDGRSVAIAVGSYATPNLRFEGEFQYTRGFDMEIDFNDGFVGNAFQGQRLKSDGSATKMSFAVNALYEFTPFAAGNSKITPFAGAGLGVARVDLNYIAPAGARFIVNDDDTGLVGSVIAGVDYPLRKNILVTARYTGLYTNSMQFRAIDTFVAGGATNTTVDSTFEHFIGVGVRLLIN